MKKTLSVFIIAVLLFCMTAETAIAAWFSGPARKLKRGVVNIVTCPAELPYRMNQECKGLGPAEGLIYGFFEGITMVVGRAAAGFFEVVTFPIPLPPEYEPILTDPESFLEKKEPPSVK